MSAPSPIPGSLHSAAPVVDLDAYCARIGYDGPHTPTLQTLRALHELHPSAIAFEAVDVLLDRGVDLSPAAIDAKLIDGRRGGYCFEQNNLFKRALVAMGFEVESLIGRVTWQAPADAPPRPRTHMALRVEVDGRPWLADVGFGGCVASAPLDLETIEPQATRHGRYRIGRQGADILVETQLKDDWEVLYRLSPEPQLDVDYEPANWLTSTHPQSFFRQALMVARTTPDARYTLLNQRLTIRTPDGREERRMLDADGLAEVLTDIFGLPVEPDWRPVLETAAAAEVQG
jgi:N-hydroxyarylamine O-acetyltransferase